LRYEKRNKKPIFFPWGLSSSCDINYHLRWRYFCIRSTQHLVHKHTYVYTFA
jgi:hypothetical protein